MIRDLWLLNRLGILQLKNRIVATFSQYPVVFILAALAATGFYLGYLKLAQMLMGFVFHQEVFGFMLAAKLLQILLYVALGIATMSSLNIAIGQLYLSRDLEFQFSLPLNFNSLIVFRYGQIFLQSSWMLIFFGAPFVLIFLDLAECTWPVQIFGLAVFVMVCTLPVTAAILICMFLVKIFPAKRVHQVFLVATVVMVASLVLVFRYLEPEQYLAPDPQSMERLNLNVSLLNLERQQWNPAIWASNAITALGEHTFAANANHAIRLIFLFFASLLVYFGAAHKLYRGSWDRALQSLGGHDLEPDTPGEVSWLGRRLGVPRWSQISRELLLFFRDPSQWSQIFVLAALLALCLFSLSKIPVSPFGESRFLFAIGGSSMGAFISLSLAGRFVFTSFSADGPAIWLMKVSPDGWRRFIFGKLVVFGGVTLLFSESLTLLSGLILDLTGYQMLVLGLSCLWDTLLMIMLALSLGMIFINPNIDNPLKMIVSPGGFLLLATGAFLVLLHVLMRLTDLSPGLNLIMMDHYWPDMQQGRAKWYFGAVILVEFALVAFLLKKGRQRLQEGDFG